MPAKLVVLYPHPTDINQFELDYEVHLKFLREKLRLPDGIIPYNVTHFAETPMGKPAFYQMFEFHFPSVEAMQQALNNPAMLEVGADSIRVSSGGPPAMMAGIE